jgi:hypothetical protein
MMCTERALLSAALMLSCMGAVGPAAAQPKPKAAPNESAFDQAGALFDKGSAYYQQGRWVEAEAAFQKAWELRQSYDVATNLGDCELEIGQARDAAEHLLYALRHFPVVAKPARRERLLQRLQEARKQVGALVVRVNVEGAEVWVDGRKVGLSPLPDEVFVEPGTRHAVEARLVGYAAAQQPVELDKGERIQVVVELVKKEGGAGAVPLEPVPASTASGSGSGSALPPLPPAARPIWPVAVGAGVALIFLGGGIGFTVAANGKNGDVASLAAKVEGRSTCYGQPPINIIDGCTALHEAVATRDTLSNAAVVGFGLGGLVALGTVGFSVWSWSRPGVGASGRVVQIVPTLGAGQRGATVVGTW